MIGVKKLTIVSFYAGGILMILRIGLNDLHGIPMPGLCLEHNA